MIRATRFCFVDRVVMSPAIFAMLPIVAGKPGSIQGQGAYRALIMRAGRTCWHVVERKFVFGAPVYYASPIVIRAYRAEP